MAGLHLERTEENGAEIDALADALAADGGGRVGMLGMLPDLPGRLRRIWAPHPRLLGRKVSAAYTWQAHDRRDPTWMPQGITHSAHTGLREHHGNDVLATSWYSKQAQGSRISVVDVEGRRYGHVLLATPTLTGGQPGLKPLKVHAGGILWHGPYLHVGGTGRGFFSCRTEDLLRVPAGSTHETFGHRYVLPVRFAYRGASDEGVGKLRFSFFTLDRGAGDATLVVGEYGSPKQSRRIARIRLDPATALPRAGDDGLVVPELDDRGEARMQGVAVVDGTYYLTSSRTPLFPGSMYVGTPGAMREHRWATPIGPEDLAWWPDTESLWSVTEHPHRRWIFAMKRRALRP